MHTASVALAALSATLMLSAPALRSVTLKTSPTARAPLVAAELRSGRSVGSPTEGRLVGGMHLDESSSVRIVPADESGDVRWGLASLVLLLERAARTVHRQFPDSVTSFGHLSRDGGGEIQQHRSHESGRDADVGFFVRTASGKPLLADHFVPFKANGTAVGWPGAFFDDARNWALVAALTHDSQTRVTHIFVASPLRARLLAFAERSGVSSSMRMRAAEVMQQPHGTLPHDDHFHVRIGCPAHMSGCIENPPPRRHNPPASFASGPRGPDTHRAARPGEPGRKAAETTAVPHKSAPQPHNVPPTTVDPAPHTPASAPETMDDADG